MARPDDSSLAPHDLRIIEERAHRLLDEADGWDQFPVPIDVILGAADLQVAPAGAFDAASIIAYIKGKTAVAANAIKSAVSKVFGLYDAGERLIHIDTTVVQSKQNFLKLHETGHDRIPTHRKLFRLFQDCRETLSPEIADQFEREANNFARYVLFKGSTFGEMAADHDLGIRIPMRLGKKFGASVYASCREYARTNRRECLVYVLEPLQTGEGLVYYAEVRRIEPSPSFRLRFGTPIDTRITPRHALWPVIPIRRKMTAPLEIVMTDLNGQRHVCLAEAFDTTYNIVVLIYPCRALATSVLTAR